MPSLEKRVAVVTGAGGGIGAAICHRLSKEGAFVVAADLNFDNASKVAEQVRQVGAGCLPIQLDVTDQCSGGLRSQKRCVLPVVSTF
jgi:meso-butanediol dehydrogenase/(S,S)-butanediol dehydrogenase/diacetyl reductase